MTDFNVFSYMDSTFMHILEDRIAHIRPLRAVDFAEDDSRGFPVERDQQFHPDQQASPLKLMVRRALFLDPAISFRPCRLYLNGSHILLVVAVLIQPRMFLEIPRQWASKTWI